MAELWAFRIPPVQPDAAAFLGALRLDQLDLATPLASPMLEGRCFRALKAVLISFSGEHYPFSFHLGRSDPSPCCRFAGHACQPEESRLGGKQVSSNLEPPMGDLN